MSSSHSNVNSHQQLQQSAAAEVIAEIRNGRLSLSVSDRDEIVDGLQLSDKHINFAQKIMKCQFSLQGLQFTLSQTTSKPNVKLFIPGAMIRS